ncbi:MAG: hypothetical protein HDQ88_06415 [Clostridia bacterium]|nr:hypothetical protein [Clostridia bacterium]
MDKKKLIPPIATFALFLMALVVALIGRDTLVINYGIRSYGMMRTVLIVTTILSALWLALSCLVRKKLQPTSTAPTVGVQDPNELTELDRTSLYDELNEFATGKWEQITDIKAIVRQLDSVNEYQAEIERLAKQNDYLQEKPSEIIQRVEDCMYINVRKLINYMRIIQVKDRMAMASKIGECINKNASLLKKVDDFIIAVVEYVNNDMARGKEEKTTDYVDSYMFVVLDAIELPETYLK